VVRQIIPESGLLRLLVLAIKIPLIVQASKREMKTENGRKLISASQHHRKKRAKSSAGHQAKYKLATLKHSWPLQKQGGNTKKRNWSN